MAVIQSDAEKEKIADEIQRAQIEAAKEQAKIQAVKLSIKELELKAQVPASTSATADPPPRNRDANRVTSLHRREGRIGQLPATF